MGNGYLWLLSSNGVPYRVTADNKIEHISEAQWKPEPVVLGGNLQKVRQVVAAPHAAFALDHSGRIFHFVLNSHLTIRRRVEIYANQRWYPVIGWSSRTLPTDRAAFSNEDGSNSGDMSGFHLKADGWHWEEPWIVHMDGWEYAVNFAGAVWKPEKLVTSFVRRRKWKRHMRYTSIEKWAEVAILLKEYEALKTNPELLPREETFVELAIGGFDILADRSCLLFALSKDGNVFRRTGIEWNNPGGDFWLKLPEIECEEGREDLTKISCSASLGTLIVLTWDGRLFLRTGISRDCQDGIAWCSLPTPQNLPVAFVSIGTKAMWTVTVDGKLWVKRLEDHHEPSSFLMHNYTEANGEVYGLSINCDDQVAATSDDGVVYLRDGVSPSEQAGRNFVRLVERTASETQKWSMVANNGARYTNLPKHWINDHVVVTNTAHFRYTSWRRQILRDLCAVNEACWEAFRSTGNELEELMEEGQELDSWNRKYAAKMRRSEERRFQSGVAFLSIHQMMFQSSTGNTIVMLLSELISAIGDFDMDTSSFTIHLRFAYSNSTDAVEIGFSEESVRDDWHELLQQPSFSTMVSSASICIPGCMESVSAGVDGVVWSLAKDGTVYALSSDYNILSGSTTCALLQTSEVLRVIYEYQKHVFIRGFASFQGETNGVSAWMEGSNSVTGLYERLPSREWSWIDQKWQLIGTEKSEDGWMYAESIDGMYYPLRGKKDKARRRIWQRRCRYEGRGPWIAIEAPQIRSIDVQKAKGDRILAWAVTMDGHVLLRQGVTGEHPQGTTWKHIIGDFDIMAISCASPTCVYATTVEGRLLRRKCCDQTDMECVDWTEVVYSPLKGVFSFCASEDFVYLLPVDHPQLNIIDVKRGKSRISLAVPKAVSVTMDRQGNLYYCDGMSIVQLERSSANTNQPWKMDFRISGRISDGSYTQCCFT